MAGVKGRSGRRPKSVEDKRLEVIDMCWEVIHQAIQDDSLSLKEKAEIAIKVAVKNIPQQIEGEVKVTQMPTIKTGDSRLGLLPLELKIGDDIRTPTDASDAGEALSDTN